jgi:hypothetical protein
MRRYKNHRKIWEDAFGSIPKDEYGFSYDIHHIDRNPHNNSLENLMCVSREEHSQIHYEAGEHAAAYAIKKRMKRGGDFSGWKHLPESTEKIRKKSSGENNAMYGKFGQNHPAYGNVGYWSGKKQPEEMIQKRVEKNTGQKRPKQSAALKGRFVGELNPNYGKKGSLSVRSKKLIDKETGLEYECMGEYCDKTNTSMYICRKLIKEGRLNKI